MLPANVPRRPLATRHAPPPAPGTASAAENLRAITRLYWPDAWKAATVLAWLLVVRLSEVWAPMTKLHPALLGSAFTSAILIIRTPGSSWQRALGDRQFITLLVYCVTIMMSVPLALWRGGAMPTVLSMPYFVMMTLVVLLCRPIRQDLDRVLNYVVLGAGAFGIITSALARVKMDVVGGERLGTGGMYDPNDLAAMLGIMIQLAIGMAMRTRGKWRLGALLSLAPMVAVFLRTGSRGGVVAFCVATPLFLLSQNIRRLIPLLLGLCIALPVAWQFGPEAFRVRTLSILHIEDDYTTQSSSGRIEIWKRGMKYFAESPVIGVGANNYAVREGKEFESRHEGGHWLTAHNTYIQVLVELGFFGAITLYVLLVGAVRDGFPLWRRPPRWEPGRLHRPEIFTALVSYLTSAVFLSHAYFYMQFFIVALCIFGRRVQEAERAAGLSGAPPRPASRRAGGGSPVVRRGGQPALAPGRAPRPA